MPERHIERWAREEAVREATRIARRLPTHDVQRDVMAPLSRLTSDQRRLVLEALRSWEALADADEAP